MVGKAALRPTIAPEPLKTWCSTMHTAPGNVDLDVQLLTVMGRATQAEIEEAKKLGPNVLDGSYHARHVFLNAVGGFTLALTMTPHRTEKRGDHCTVRLVDEPLLKLECPRLARMTGAGRKRFGYLRIREEQGMRGRSIPLPTKILKNEVVEDLASKIGGWKNVSRRAPLTAYRNSGLRLVDRWNNLCEYAGGNEQLVEILSKVLVPSAIADIRLTLKMIGLVT